MARTRRRVPYGVQQLSTLLGISSEKMILPLVRNDFVKTIFDEYRQGISKYENNRSSAPEHVPWKLGNILRLMKLRDIISTTHPDLAYSLWWCGEGDDGGETLSQDKSRWMPDFHAVRFVCRLDRWIDEINGGWVRDEVDWGKEIVRLAAILVFMHDTHIGYVHRMKRHGI